MEGLKQAKEKYSMVIATMLTHSEYQRPFYGQFLLRVNLQWTDKIPTAGVSITDGINLYINPKFWNELSFMMAMEVLEHEVMHVVYLHPLRMKEIGDELNQENAKLHNIAADAKINENLPEIRDEGRFVSIKKINDELKSKGSSDQLTATDNSESYYWIMKKNQDLNDDNSGYGETVDDHTPWAESTANEAMAKSIVAKTGNEASQAAGIGNTPEEMLRQIQKLSKSLVNWKQQLRQFFANALKADHEKTRNRRNRRYGLLQSGRRKKQKLNIACMLDSSGSVGDAQFSQFFSELDSIVGSQDVEVTIIEADTQVSAVYAYKKGMEIKRHSCGGTLYQGAIDKAKELKVDAGILFGDFDSADNPVNPGFPFLWVGVNTNSKPPGNFGRAIYIEAPNV